MQIPDTDTSEYAALIEMAATGGRVRDERIAHFAAVMTASFWRLTPQVLTGAWHSADSGVSCLRN